MIGIQLDGDNEFLETVQDTSIDITLNNPLLGDAENLSPGSYSMPFKIPGGQASPKNEAKLKHPSVIENNDAYQIQKASLFYDGVPFKKGTIKANGSDEKSLDTYFLFGLNSISPSLKTARLREIINYKVDVTTTRFIKKVYFKKITGGDWSVTINGKTFTGTGIAPDIDLRNAINADYISYTSTSETPIPFATTISGGTTPGGMTSPWIEIFLTKYNPSNPSDYYVGHEYELSVSVDESEAANYKFEDGFDWASYYSAYQTFLAPYNAGTFPSGYLLGTFNLRFPVLFNSNLYEDEQNIRKSSEIINAVTAAGIVGNDSGHFLNPTPQNRNSIQPFLLLKGVLDWIAFLFLFKFEGDFIDDPDFANLLIDNGCTLDLPQEYIGTDKYVFWRSGFNLNELVPDITVIDFLKGLATRYNLGIYFNETTQKVRFKFREPTAKSVVYDDITSLSSTITSIEDKRVTGYSLVVKKDESDKLSLSNETLVVGTSQETIDITCGRLQQETSQISRDGGANLIGPRVARKNNNPEFAFRVFHFKGMDSSGSFSYQRASIHGANFKESLADVDSVDGIHSHHYKYWLFFKKNWRAITITVDWPLRMLMNFDWEIKRRFDRSNYIVNSIKIRMTNQSVEASEVELYTMN